MSHNLPVELAGFISGRVGSRVRDTHTDRTGTIQYGWMTGEPSLVWDDDPEYPEFYFEYDLEVIEGGAA